MCYYSCIIYSSIWQWPELNRSMWYLFYVLPQLSTILFFFPGLRLSRAHSLAKSRVVRPAPLSVSLTPSLPGQRHSLTLSVSLPGAALPPSTLSPARRSSLAGGARRGAARRSGLAGGARRGRAGSARPSGLGVADWARCARAVSLLAGAQITAAAGGSNGSGPDPAFSVRGSGFASGGATPSGGGFARIWWGPSGGSNNDDDDGAPIQRATAAAARGFAHRTYPRVFFFYVFYSIYRDGHSTASEKVLFTVTFPPRRLRCCLG
jgi:hypothetical protein